jgi:hypothetical protein
MARAWAARRTKWSRSATLVARRAASAYTRRGGSGVAAQLVQVAADGVPADALADDVAQRCGGSSMPRRLAS